MYTKGEANQDGRSNNNGPRSIKCTFARGERKVARRRRVATGNKIGRLDCLINQFGVVRQRFLFAWWLQLVNGRGGGIAGRKKEEGIFLHL